MHPHLRRLLALFAFPILILAVLGCARGPCVAIVAPDGNRRATVTVEVASNTPQREVGLMYRKHLDESAGMLFVFRDAAHRDFWMHNTVIALDMIFADGAGRVIGIVANAEPFSDKLLGVEGDSEYVLEVNGGFCAKNGIKAGDRFEFSGFAPSASD